MEIVESKPDGYLTQVEFERRERLKLKYQLDLEEMQGRRVQLIVFALKGQHYGLEIGKTREVVKTQPISPIPHVPDYILGVSNIRGVIIPIIDLSVKFKLKDAGKSVNQFVVVVENNGYKTGLLVPQVPSTINVEGNNIGSASGIITDAAQDETYIKAVVKMSDYMIFFLDIEELVEGSKVSILPSSLPAKNK